MKLIPQPLPLLWHDRSICLYFNERRDLRTALPPLLRQREAESEPFLQKEENQDPNKTGKALRAIDVHVHVHTGQQRTEVDPRLRAAKEYFKKLPPQRSVEELASYYRSQGLRAVIFDVDHETQTGMKMSNDEIADAARRFPDVFIGFGSVDPWKGMGAVKEVERCAKELKLRGMKFQPNAQAFFPNEQRFYPVYEACARLDLITIFHTGMTGIGAGTPGGSGVHLKYSRPIPYLDDVAADFPSLRIIAAHPSWPWQEEMLAVARHKGNVFLDLSGWAPKYFPESLIQHANTLLQDKVMFGTDYPLIDPERWLGEFAQLPIRDEVRRKILYSNAARLLGLGAEGEIQQ